MVLQTPLLVSLVLTSKCKFIHALGFHFPRKTIFRLRTQRSWETICNKFLAQSKFKGTHLLNVSNFWTSYFFLGPGSHKPVMFNALRKWFKMANNRKMIDANQRWLSYITQVITKNCSASQDCVDSVNWSLRLKMSLGNYFSVPFFLRPGKWHSTTNDRYCEILGLVHLKIFAILFEVNAPKLS